MADYLKSNDIEEKNAAYEVLKNDNAIKLTCNLWNLLDKNTKEWLISKIMSAIRNPMPLDIDHLLDIHDLEYLFRRLEQRRYSPSDYLDMIKSALVFYEEFDLLHPLWLKLKITIKKTNDEHFMEKIEQYEQEMKNKIQRFNEKLKLLLQTNVTIPSRHTSKNIMFDPSLLLDYEKAIKAFNFMRKHYDEFNFYIPSSFYRSLEKYRNNWEKYDVGNFFEYNREYSLEKILILIYKHREYFTFFEISKHYKEKYWYFYENLSKEIENKEVLEILFEEWVFLLEYSWIVSKAKVTFEKFKKAGAVVLEVSKIALDKLARDKINKKDNEELSTMEKLRGIGKWIAQSVAIIVSAAFLNLIIGPLISDPIINAFFVLIDPEEVS